MRNIIELIFCLVALVALLVFSQNSKVKNVETEEALVKISEKAKPSVGDNVAMAERQK